MSIIFPNQNNLTHPFDESWATLRPVLSSIQQVDGSYDVNQLTPDQLAMCLCTIQELVTSYNKIIESGV
jgi:hypothetical protein